MHDELETAHAADSVCPELRIEVILHRIKSGSIIDRSQSFQPSPTNSAGLPFNVDLSLQLRAAPVQLYVALCSSFCECNSLRNNRIGCSVFRSICCFRSSGLCFISSIKSSPSFSNTNRHAVRCLACAHEPQAASRKRRLCVPTWQRVAQQWVRA